MKDNQFKQSQTEPFLIVKTDKKYAIAVGNNIVSRKTFDTIKQAEQYIYTKPYDLIINTCLCMFYQIQKNDENKTESGKDEETNNPAETTN